MLWRRSSSMLPPSLKDFLAEDVFLKRICKVLNTIIPERLISDIGHGYLCIRQPLQWHKMGYTKKDTWKRQSKKCGDFSCDLSCLVFGPPLVATTHLSACQQRAPSSILLFNYRQEWSGRVEEEVITPRLWGSTWGIISPGSKAAGDTTAWHQGFLPRRWLLGSQAHNKQLQHHLHMHSHWEPPMWRNKWSVQATNKYYPNKYQWLCQRGVAWGW